MKTYKMCKKESIRKYFNKALEYGSCTENRAKQYFYLRYSRIANCIDFLEDDTVTSLVQQGVDARLEIEFEILDALIFMIEEFDAPYEDKCIHISKGLNVFDEYLDAISKEKDDYIKSEIESSVKYLRSKFEKLVE